MKADVLAVADDVYAGGFREFAHQVDVEVLERAEVGAQQDVVVGKSQCLGLLVELHTHGHVLGRDKLFAPGEEHHGVDEEREEEVDQHAANHDQQSLPSGLGAELPGLGRLCHLLFVEALVYHTGYLAVAAQWQPAYAILGVAGLGLEAEELARPLADTHIEEDEEFLYSYAEELGKEHVSSFMQEDKQRDCQNELEQSD